MLSKFTSAELRVRFRFRAILAIGLLSAAVIYVVNAGPAASEYELERSKMYLHDMEVYGGKANVLADEFRIWFDGLWHGRSLAYTVAVIAVFAALAYRFVASPLPEAIAGEAKGQSNGPPEA